MIVQYIIDWSYIHREVLKASSARIEIIRFNLMGLHKAIRENGVLFVDERQCFIKGLNDILKNLKQGEESEQVPQWLDLANVLTTFRSLYDEYRILLPPPNNEGISALLESRQKFLNEANLNACQLPCVMITDIEINENDVQALTIDRYLDSSIEKDRQGWRSISFTTGNEDIARKFWQSLSLCACSFKKVTLYDPYSSGLIVLGQCRNHDEWRCSFQAIFQWVIRNNHIRSLRIVGKLNTTCGQTFQLEQFRQEIQRMMLCRNARRNQDMTLQLRFCFKRALENNAGFHDRWIDAGAHTCVLSVGLDVYHRSRNNVIEISRPFSVCAITDVSKQRNAVDAMSCHSYNDISRDVGDQWRSGAVDDTVKTDIQPPIFLRIGGLS